MTARVFVTLKTSVLDPQGQTIRAALQTMGHATIRDVRAGKFFDVVLEAADRGAATAELDQISRDILSNPVIEEYRVELLD